MAFVYIPNGVEQKYWQMTESGPFGELSRLLKPLESLKSEFSVISGLAQNKGAGAGGDHARALAAYLTGVGCKKTEGADFQAGVSMDQLVAERIGRDTPLHSSKWGWKMVARWASATPDLVAPTATTCPGAAPRCRTPPRLIRARFLSACSVPTQWTRNPGQEPALRAEHSGCRQRRHPANHR